MTRILCLLQLAALAPLCSGQTSGYAIRGNAGAGSATIQLTGVASSSTVSNSTGFYRFGGLAPGQYVVTPVLTGYSFSPPSQTVMVTVTNASVGGINFSATPIAVTAISLVASPTSVSLSASGAVQQLQVEATYSNESIQDVTAESIYASNNTSVAAVSQAGVVTAIGNGSATIIVSYGGVATSVSVAVEIASATYTISGSAGIASATVTLTGASNAITIAFANGAYSFSGLSPGNYAIAASLSDYSFSPSSQSATITNNNVSGLNFTASPVSHSVDLTWGAGSIQSPAPGQVVVGYNVYRGSISGGPYTQLNAIPVTGLTYTDNAVSSGETWYYVCSTVDNLNDVSSYSNQAAATIP